MHESSFSFINNKKSSGYSIEEDSGINTYVIQ
jgi:hypothetical protein